MWLFAGRGSSEFAEVLKISSYGGARENWPGLMGTYKLTNRKYSNLPVYKHLTEEAYLYVNELDDWVVNDELGIVATLFAHRQTNSDKPPRTGWNYADGDWESDPSLTVQEVA